MQLSNESFYFHDLMQNVNNKVMSYYGSNIELINSACAPELMSAFSLVYIYKPLKYKILFEVERHIISIKVTETGGGYSRLNYIYPDIDIESMNEANESNANKMLELLFNALDNKQIKFYTHNKRGERIEKRINI